jgi:hypothetical protein
MEEVAVNMPQNDDEGELPPWFAQHKAETDKRFGALDYTLRSLHDKLQQVLGVHGTRHDASVRGDEEALDPDIASGEPVKPGEHILENDGPPAGMIRSTGDVNRRNRQLHHRPTRDAKRLVIRTLGDLNRHNAHTYRKRD